MDRQTDEHHNCSSDDQMSRSMTNSGGSTMISSSSLETSGSERSLVVSEGGGLTSVSGGSVTTSGPGATGLYATGVGSSVTTNLLAGVGTTVVTTGASAVGAQADAGGAITLGGGSVTTSGTGATGLYVTGAGSTLMASGVEVTTGSGANNVADGVLASSEGAATLYGGSVTTSGPGATGLYATGVGSSVTTNLLAGVGTTVVTTGANAVGAQADAGGAVTLGGGIGDDLWDRRYRPLCHRRRLHADGVGCRCHDWLWHEQCRSRRIGLVRRRSDAYGGSVTTSGPGATGLYATGVGSSVTTNCCRGRHDGLTTGANAVGAQADTGGAVTLGGGIGDDVGDRRDRPLRHRRRLDADGVGRRCHDRLWHEQCRMSAYWPRPEAQRRLRADRCLRPAPGRWGCRRPARARAYDELRVGTTVSTTGANAVGAQADTGGAVTLGGGSVTTSGTGATGLYVTGAGSTLMASGVAVTTGSGTNNVAVGVLASIRRRSDAYGGSVSTCGPGARGCRRRGSGRAYDELCRVGTTVVTTGANAVGAQADAGGAVTLGGGSVTTSGTGATGLYVTGAGSTLMASGVEVTTGSGTNNVADGVLASAKAQRRFTGGSVTTSGPGRYGSVGDGRRVERDDELACRGRHDGCDHGRERCRRAGGHRRGGHAGRRFGDDVRPDAHALVVTGFGIASQSQRSHHVRHPGLRCGRTLCCSGRRSRSDRVSDDHDHGRRLAATGFGRLRRQCGRQLGRKSNSPRRASRPLASARPGFLPAMPASSGTAGSITVSGTLNPQDEEHGGRRGRAARQRRCHSRDRRAARSPRPATRSNSWAGRARSRPSTISPSPTQPAILIFADPSVSTVNFNNTTANAGANNLLDATNGSAITLNANASALTGAIQTDSDLDNRVNLTMDRHGQ